jgi:NADPH:quinone reductase-like Zn-dependent oxidoreductase
MPAFSMNQYGVLGTEVLGARIIFDPIAGTLLDKLAETAAPGATIFSIRLALGNLDPLSVGAVSLAKSLNIRGYWLSEIVSVPERLARAGNYVFEKVKSGQFKLKIAKTFPFEKVVEACQCMEANEHIGKIVLTVDR